MFISYSAPSTIMLKASLLVISFIGEIFILSPSECKLFDRRHRYTTRSWYRLPLSDSSLNSTAVTQLSTLGNNLQSDEGEDNQNLCISNFKDDDLTPWWRIDLQDIYYVYRIVLHNIQLRDPTRINFQVRVGFTDIVNVKKEDMLKANNLCIHVTFLRIYEIMKYCNTPVIGRYVSIHFMNDSDLLLTPCNIRIWGKPPREEIYRARAKKLTQSSSPFNNNIDLAMDGINDTRYEIVRDKLQCFQLKVDVNRSEPYVEIDLETITTVKNITLYTVDLDEDFYDNIEIQISVQNVSRYRIYSYFKDVNNISCVRTYAYSKDKNEYLCPSEAKGKYMTIRLIPKCVDINECSNSRPLNIGEVEIWGYEEMNEFEDVAKKKPTKQSSYLFGGESHVAVDGLYLSPSARNTSACSFIGKLGNADLFPWWRIDLLTMHYVHGMTIQQWSHLFFSRYFYIEARVGDVDIDVLYNMDVMFKGNFICKGFVNRNQSETATSFDCETPLIGQFVSLQVTSVCGVDECYGIDYSFLTLCEVDVFGFPIRIKEVENVAANKSFAVSRAVKEMTGDYDFEDNNTDTFQNIFDIPGRREMEEAFQFPWWRIDLEKSYVIQSVVLFTKKIDPKTPPQEIVVRVGLQDISEFHRARYFIGNLLCIDTKENIKMTRKITLECEQPVLGRFVSIQFEELCSYMYCTVSIPEIKRIEVLGFKLERLYNESDLAMGKRTYSGINAEYSYLINDGKIPDQLHIKETVKRCSSTTDKDPFPWLMLNFYFATEVSGVILYNVAGEKSKFLHDVEVRVARYALPLRNANEPFKHEQLCAAVYNRSLPEGRNVLKCNRPIYGTTITIQIVQPCTDITCGLGNQNVLILCELQIVHMNISFFGLENISDDKPIKQSSVKIKTPAIET